MPMMASTGVGAAKASPAGAFDKPFSEVAREYVVDNVEPSSGMIYRVPAPFLRAEMFGTDAAHDQTDAERLQGLEEGIAKTLASLLTVANYKPGVGHTGHFMTSKGFGLPTQSADNFLGMLRMDFNSDPDACIVPPGSLSREWLAKVSSAYRTVMTTWEPHALVLSGADKLNDFLRKIASDQPVGWASMNNTAPNFCSKEMVDGFLEEMGKTVRPDDESVCASSGLWPILRAGLATPQAMDEDVRKELLEVLKPSETGGIEGRDDDLIFLVGSRQLMLALAGGKSPGVFLLGGTSMMHAILLSGTSMLRRGTT